METKKQRRNSFAYRTVSQRIPPFFNRYLRYNQFLVVRSLTPVPDSRQVSWLKDPYLPLSSQAMPSDAFCSRLPYHSDEIVQDFHLLPFYLLLGAAQHQIPLQNCSREAPVVLFDLSAEV